MSGECSSLSNDLLLCLESVRVLLKVGGETLNQACTGVDARVDCVVPLVDEPLHSEDSHFQGKIWTELFYIVQ